MTHKFTLTELTTVVFSFQFSIYSNTDFSFQEGINMYRWYYISPTRWGLVWGLTSSGTMTAALNNNNTRVAGWLNLKELLSLLLTSYSSSN